MNVKTLSAKYKDYVINLRRHFHSYPEPSLKEFKTCEKIQEELKKLNIPYITTAGTGIIASIKGPISGKTIALRADIDALEICEKNEVPYKSKNAGYMHACGHDGHTASLLGAAHILKELQNDINGTVILIFQPAEENGKGSSLIINEGILKNVDEIFGIHVISDIECGKISVEAGPVMASSDSFKITVNGKGGHGAKPAQTIDALVAASAVVVNLQSLISREIDTLEPAVMSIGTFNSGTSYNIIASQAVLEGTVRCFNDDIRQKISYAIERIASNTANAYRACVSMDYKFLVRPVINTAASSALAKKSVEKILSKDAVIKADKLLIAEDFSKYLELIPGAFAFVGARNEKKEACFAHHNDRFNIDEDCLEIASALYAQYALDYLAEKE